MSTVPMKTLTIGGTKLKIVDGDADTIIASKFSGDGVAGGSWVQGGYGNIGSVHTPNTSSKRIRNCVTLDVNDVVAIDRTLQGFEYVYGLFDSTGTTRIQSNANWQTGRTEIPASGKCMLFISVRHSDDSDITPDEIFTSGIKVEVDRSILGLKGIEQIEHGYQNIAMQATWEQKTWASLADYSSARSSNVRRLSTEIVFESPTTLLLRMNNTQYAFAFYAFDVDNRPIVGNATYTWGRFVVVDSVKTLRVIIRNQSDTSSNNIPVYASDIIQMGMEILYHRSYTAHPFELKVMTYNIGRFSYGVDPKYLSVDYDEKLANYKRFFSEQMCDIIGLQECNKYLDVASGTGTKNTHDIIFSPLGYSPIDNDGNVCLKSKYKINAGDTVTLSTGRKVATGYININDRAIFIASCHLTPNAGSDKEALRATERAELIAIVQNKEYFILFGDFNCQTGYESDYAEFTDEGFKIANGGYLPYEWTYSYNSADFASDTPSSDIRYMDNIITSGNIAINYSERVNVYSELSSDHIPYIAYLTIT